MPEARVYKLYFPPSLKFFLAFQVVGFVGAGVAIVAFMLLSHHQKGPPWPFPFIFLGFMAFYLYWVLSLPYRITLTDDGGVEFISLLRRRTLRAQEIESIKPGGSMYGAGGFLVVRASQGKIRLFAQFDGFHDFLTRLENLNPAVELRGC